MQCLPCFISAVKCISFALSPVFVIGTVIHFSFWYFASLMSSKFACFLASHFLDTVNVPFSFASALVFILNVWYTAGDGGIFVFSLEIVAMNFFTGLSGVIVS